MEQQAELSGLAKETPSTLNSGGIRSGSCPAASSSSEHGRGKHTLLLRGLFPGVWRALHLVGSPHIAVHPRDEVFFLFCQRLHV
jgi:hypothetical protein